MKLICSILALVLCLVTVGCGTVYISQTLPAQAIDEGALLVVKNHQARLTTADSSYLFYPAGRSAPLMDHYLQVVGKKAYLTVADSTYEFKRHRSLADVLTFKPVKP